jgi:DNA invertase Pin-like site-specific DNA recombinase
MIAIIAQFAQMERSTLIERIKSGMNRAKNIEGKHCGRPKGSKIEKG